MKTKPNILVCPLDWGIGHATRCVPIINELLAQNANAIIGASERSMDFLKQEFPGLQIIDFPGYSYSYPSKGSMALSMALQAPIILKGIKGENNLLKKLFRDYHIDGIISDNRYGLYSEDIPSIFMTHQIFIQTPPFLGFLKPILFNMNKRFIQRFNEYWIPDFKGRNNLSGDLSHKSPIPSNCYFIGPLSRFDSNQKPQQTDYKYKILVMLSGPEPQRTVLENLLIGQLSNLQLKSAMVCGKTEKMEQKTINGNIDLFSHLTTEKLKNLILESEIIVSRPGYSTVMDLVALGKKAIFIPTPGQTEQIYLGKYYRDNQYYYSMSQKNINLEQAMDNCKKFNGIQLSFDDTILKERISNLLEKLNAKS